MKLILASHNAKKAAELASLLAPLSIELVAPSTLGIAEAEEPFGTFVENALAKARHAAAASGLPAVADDSGLCVEALGGAPGVRSARFAPIAPPASADADREARRQLQDAANNALLLERLCGTTDRRARFVATLVAVRSADDPEPLVAVGRWHGDILESARGRHGFGYDPLLHIGALGRSVAELDAETKNAHSHRALAARALLTMLREAWHLG